MPQLGDLRPNPANPRKIKDKQAKMLKKSLEDFGDLGGFVYNVASSQIVGGHRRQEALPASSKIVIEKRYDPPTKTGTVAEGYIEAHGERFKYREVKWDSAREKAANLAANKHGGEFDMAMVDKWMSELSEVNFDLELTGFDDWEKPVVAVEGEDEVPVARATKICLGDLFALDGHRLLCADSTDPKQVERLMNGEKADMVFTSPPYNADTLVGEGDIFTSKKSKKLYSGGYSDDLSSEDYVTFAKSVLDLSFTVTDGFIFWNVSYNKKSRFEYISQISDRLDFLIEQICWKKSSTIPFKGSLMRDWEPIYLFSTGKNPLGLDVVTSNFWEISNTNSQQEHHKACFPVALPEKAIGLVRKKSGVLYEPFCGSGSTLIACEKTNRKCYGSEIDPSYCDVILQRWEKFSGKTAYLIGDANGELKSDPVPFAKISSLRLGTHTAENKSIVPKNVGKSVENIGK